MQAFDPCSFKILSVCHPRHIVTHLLIPEKKNMGNKLKKSRVWMIFDDTIYTVIVI